MFLNSSPAMGDNSDEGSSYVEVESGNGDVSLGQESSLPIPVLDMEVVPDRIDVQSLGVLTTPQLPPSQLEAGPTIEVATSHSSGAPTEENRLDMPDRLLPEAVAAAALPVATVTSVPVALAPAIAAAAEMLTPLQLAAQVANSTREAVQGARAAANRLDRAASTLSSTQSEASSIPSSAGALARNMLIDNDIAILPKPKGHQLNGHQPTKEAITLVKMGDNSIVTTGITSQLAVDIPSRPNPDYADFARVMRDRLPDMRDAFITDNDAHGTPRFRIQSTIYSCEVGGRTGPGVLVTQPIFQCASKPIEPKNRTTYTMRAGPCRSLGCIPAASLDPYLQGGNVSERFVVSAIQPKLNMACVSAARFLAEYLTSAREVCDNLVMYAKLYYQALVYDVVQQLGLQPSVDAFPAGNDVNYVNLDDPNLDYTSISKPIVRGDIILVHRIDYDDVDLQIVNWIAKPDSRATAAGGTFVPLAAYVNWPAIPVTVLYHGSAPAMPQATALSSDRIYAYAAKLAAARGEWGAAQRGFYMALDHLGIVYEHNGAEEKDRRWHFRTPCMSYHSPTVPMPRDYNVLLRVLNIRPEASIESRLDVDAFTSTTCEQRVAIAGIYNLAISVLATTILYDYNLTTAQLSAWGVQAPVLSPSAAAVIQRCSEPAAPGKTEPPFFTRVKTLMPIFLGATVPHNFYVNSSWLGSPGASDNAQVAYFQQAPNYPPRNGNPLSIDNWLLVRPMEWGVSGPHTTVDLTKELIDVGSANGRGWRSVRGSEFYGARVVSSFPVPIVTYGIQVLNAILNDFRWGRARPITFSTANWSPNHGCEWNTPSGGDGWQGSYMSDLHIMEPCTIMSYRYEDELVAAPALTGTRALPDADRRRLSNWRGGEQSQVGFYPSPAVPTTTFTPFTSAMDMSSMFSALAPEAPQSAAASVAAVTNPHPP